MFLPDGSEVLNIYYETNETKFGTDSIKLAEVMRDIREEYEVEDVMETMPFTRGEMDNFQGMLEFDWSQFNNSGIDGFEDPSPQNEDEAQKPEISTKTTVTCPHCSGSFELS